MSRVYASWARTKEKTAITEELISGIMLVSDDDMNWFVEKSDVENTESCDGLHCVTC